MSSVKEARAFSPQLRDANSPFLPARRSSESSVRVGFVLLEHFSMMAFTSAVDALVTANLVNKQALFNVTTYGLGTRSIRSDLGIDIQSNFTLDELPLQGDEALDILIVCGGFRCALGEFPQLSSTLKQADQQKIMLGGLWNGCIPLAHAGLLDGRACALHPDNHELLQEQFPRVQLSDNVVVIESDRISSAGPNSALEMMLTLIEQQCDAATVRAIREILSCDQSARSSLDDDTTTTETLEVPEPVQELVELMCNNIEEPLAIDELASFTGMSRRRVERLFQTHLNSSPSRYYLELRITRARRLLLQSQDSVATIAAACGFISSTHFSHCFKDFFGIAPSQARQQHQQQNG